MAQNFEIPKNIMLDGVEHELEKLGPQVQALVKIHTQWRGDLADARLVVAKNEAALRALEAEIGVAVQKVLQESAEAESTKAAGEPTST